jgi:CDP-diacylglycerol--glycerol-3-phosphate 3-phosphatidyltransferase
MLTASIIPLSLTFIRVLLAPVIILAAIYHPNQVTFGGCLILAFLSDIFDGIIARRLNVATPTLRRLDSIADTVFYGAAVFAAWHLHPGVIEENITALLALAVVEVSRYVYDFAKFRREASYHMWSSKLWGICLFIGFFALLALDISGLPIVIAIYVGIIADLEGLAISVILNEWKTDVPTFVHALRLRSNDATA